MTVTTTGPDVHDVRLATAAAGDGPDATGRGHDSASHVEPRADAPDRAVGAGPAPTDGRGDERTRAAVRAPAHHVVGRPPGRPGHSATMRPASVAGYSLPDGPTWR